jgi:hypothetical protein
MFKPVIRFFSCGERCAYFLIGIGMVVCAVFVISFLTTLFSTFDANTVDPVNQVVLSGF